MENLQDQLSEADKKPDEGPQETAKDITKIPEGAVPADKVHQPEKATSDQQPNISSHQNVATVNAAENERSMAMKPSVPAAEPISVHTLMQNDKMDALSPLINDKIQPKSLNTSPEPNSKAAIPRMVTAPNVTSAPMTPKGHQKRKSLH